MQTNPFVIRLTARLRDGRQNVTLALLCLLLVFSCPGQAGLQNALDNVFGDLANATQPSFYKGQRRGALIGGSYYARTRIMRPNLVSFQPPSFRAGCGGIDLFGGSFSFISADQFVQLLRSIGQAAVGYAFEIALNAICGDCLEILADLQRKVQSLNEFFGNSCKMAQFLVDNTIGPPVEALGERIHNMLPLVGAATDAFDARNKNHPANALKQSNEALAREWVFENIVWRGLKESDTYSWFNQQEFGMINNGNQFLEAIMSMTGTVIIKSKEDNNTEYLEDYEVRPVPKILKVQDLLRGGKVTLWKCNGYGKDECLDPTTQQEDIEGMDTKVEKLVREIMDAFKNNTPLSGSARSFMEHSLGVGALLRNLSLKSTDAMEVLAFKSAPIISAEITYVIANDMIRSAMIAVRKVNHPHTGEAIKILSDSMKEIEQEYQTIIAERGNLNDLAGFYNNLMQSFPPQEEMRHLGQQGASVNQIK